MVGVAVSFVMCQTVLRRLNTIVIGGKWADCSMPSRAKRAWERRGNRLTAEADNTTAAMSSGLITLLRAIHDIERLCDPPHSCRVDHHSIPIFRNQRPG